MPPPPKMIGRTVAITFTFLVKVGHVGNALGGHENPDDPPLGALGGLG